MTWQVKRLADFVESVSTGPFGSSLHKSDYAREGVPLVNPINIVDERIVPDPNKLVSKETLRRLSSYVLQDGDIIVGRRGEIGRCAVVGPSESGWVCGTGSFFVRPLPTLDPKFLAHLLRSEEYRKQLERAATGATMKNLSSAALSSLMISVPPFSEQQRIVGILAEAFAAIATAKANAEKNLQNARALFESYTQTLFSQPGNQPVVQIGEVAEVFDGPHATPRTVDTGPVFLGISALQDGRVNLKETRHVTPSDFRQWTRRVTPQAYDVVFSYETRLGQAALLPEGLKCCLGRRMGLVRVNRNRVDPRFFVYQYISPPFREFLGSKVVRGATVDRISIKEFPSFPIILPPLSEQIRLADKLDSIQELSQHLALTYQTKLAALAELKKSILHQAFSGQL